MEQGKVEKKILETCYRERLPIPDKIKNAPELQLGLDLYYGAYLDLGSSRSGMGDGVIPWHEVEMYARLNEFDDDQKENLHYFVARLDEVFLGKINGQRS